MKFQPPTRRDYRVVVAVALLGGLLAFEWFNFDTTRYALSNLLGDVAFLSVGWATILAVAFCAIDVAVLVRFFAPEEAEKEVWYLIGAWLLGATMNAGLTWWAVRLTMVASPGFGNEILSQEQLLTGFPIFVAALVWLTRILFIGGLTVAAKKMSTDPPADGQVATRQGLSSPPQKK